MAHGPSEVELGECLSQKLSAKLPIGWVSDRHVPAPDVLPGLCVGLDTIRAADSRLRRWGPTLAALFPELSGSGGVIESGLLPLPAPGSVCGHPLAGKAFVKADHALPVAGSIKARGGIFEIIVHAERLALEHRLIDEGDDPARLIAPDARALFARHRVGVGSTGNLGLSIGVMASALGFQTSVHMSSDAKSWKKERLRSLGAEVVEHAGDYALAVRAGREEMARSTDGYFVDDENSLDLLVGYSVAALRLASQLCDLGVEVDERHPLNVYLPCGVGGAPGGITLGLKHLFGDAVRCYYAEPVASPAFLARFASAGRTSVYDLGLDNRTEADGLAVAEASELVFRLVERLVDGCFTVTDDELFEVLVRLQQETGLRIEPSAAAGFLGPKRLSHALATPSPASEFANSPTATHVFWTTGGAFVPEDEYWRFHQRGSALLGD